MSDYEKRIEEMAKRHCGSGSGVHCTIDCDGICYCSAYKFAKDAIDADYRKGDEVRKETLQTLFTEAIKHSFDIDELKSVNERLAVKLESLREIIKDKFGVEVEE